MNPFEARDAFAAFCLAIGAEEVLFGDTLSKAEGVFDDHAFHLEHDGQRFAWLNRTDNPAFGFGYNFSRRIMSYGGKQPEWAESNPRSQRLRMSDFAPKALDDDAVQP